MVRFLISFSILFWFLKSFGCNPLQIQTSLQTSPHDWKMFGRTSTRTNTVTNNLIPPLEEIWRFETSAGFSPYSPIVIDSFLFVSDLNGEINMLNAKTGEYIGSRKFGSAIVGSPIADGNYLYVPLTNSKASLVAYNLRNAAIEWQVKGGNIESSPLIIGSKLLVTTLEGMLICSDKTNGQSIWVFDPSRDKKNKSIHSSPASDSEIVVFGSGDGVLCGVAIENGSLIWQTKVRGSIVASPSIRNGKVFVGSFDSTYYSFDIKTGRQIWAQNLGGIVLASQAVNEHHVIVGTVEGIIYCMDINDGVIVWRVRLGGVVNSAPLISGNTIFIGCFNRVIYALSAETGEFLWQQKIEGRIRSMPVVSRNLLIILSDDQNVVAFRKLGEK
ncbi:MAG: PQQ-binding-like beta-propeller repeat protein [Bacteroidota bacterium]|nr:PQQ-binding-like beta-propeller repeat protein [Bacteroidota bacterium]